jgi:hypothetical protein
MKQFLLCVLLLGFVVSFAAGQAPAVQKAAPKMIPRYNSITKTWGTYPVVSCRQIQEVPTSNLLKADTLQNSNPAADTLLFSPYENSNGSAKDTLTILVTVVVPPKIFTWNNCGYTMLVADPGAEYTQWGGLFVQGGSFVSYETQLNADGWLSIERGDTIMMTGTVMDFPAYQGATMNSVTEFVPIVGIHIDRYGKGPVPKAIEKNVTDFYKGKWGTQGAKINFSGGEPYEDLIVEFHGVTVDGPVNATNGTFKIGRAHV